jgi:hypothetical protein
MFTTPKVRQARAFTRLTLPRCCHDRLPSSVSYPAIGPLGSKLRMLDHRIVRTSLSKGVQGSHNFRYVSRYAEKDNVSSLSFFFSLTPSLHHDIRQVHRAARRLPALPPCPQIGHRWPRPDALCGAVLHHYHSLRPSLHVYISIYADDDHDYTTDTSSPVRRGVELEMALKS